DLTAIIRQERPRTIITHDPYPGNGSLDSCAIYPDHTSLGLIAFQAAYLCGPGPLFYPEQVRAGLAPHRVGMLYLIMSDRPDVFVDVEPVWDKRMRALRQHASQGRDRPEMEEFFRRIAGALGTNAGCKLAEGFRKLPPS
ncbi:MAG TPA: PIG-L family deacetylase, partial [Methylomirabilota bacterium]|nr:PIG-L family deacetylase [Methylomirabilota bacterium]